MTISLWLARLALAVCLTAAPIVAGVAQSAGTADATDAQTPSWLLVIEGEVQAVSNGVMTLQAEPSGIAFTERPSRQTRYFRVDALDNSAWGEGGTFASDPPNASLVNITTDALGAITLSNAVWEDGVVEMRFEMLEGAPPSAGDRVALTVDHFRGPCAMVAQCCWGCRMHAR